VNEFSFYDRLPMADRKKTIADEIDHYEELRSRVLAALNGLRNAPRTKRALKRHLRLVEAALVMLDRDFNSKTHEPNPCPRPQEDSPSPMA